VGGLGIQLLSGASVQNSGVIAGGYSHTGTGGVGVLAGVGSSVTDEATALDSIKGGSSASGNGGTAVVLDANATLDNGPFSTVMGGSGLGTGGIGVDLTAAGASLTNVGKIYGGTGASSPGGTTAAGIVLTAGTSANNERAGNYFGKIYGGTGISGNGGVGVYLDGGQLTTAGDIFGGEIKNNSTAFVDAVQFGSQGGTMVVEAGARFFGNIGGFGLAAADKIDITNLNPTQVAADYNGVTHSIGLNANPGGTLQFDGSFAGEHFVFTPDGAGTDVTIACYLRGTQILTERGEVPIETLMIGDRVLTLTGTAQPIRWIGRRRYSGDFAAGNKAVQPVRFHPGSLGGGLPARDLWVSPEHAMYVDGWLIPAALLINGRTIVQEEDVEAITYFHLEFDSHAVIYAEGAAAESFVDDESRRMFDNAREYATLYPEAPDELARFCAPRVEYGEELEAVRRRLAAEPGPPGAIAHRASARFPLRLIAAG
jgi:hypothetical protein